ncbi:hypothetical protein [Litoribacter populi]|uniref:hypothetical protein n=1 Tax=Litoribacter populi TaxID=2598460 RepID=UPI00117D4775|nr:hypothetical protein [Litoribacter populi]
MNIDFETSVDQIRKVNPNRNYWFIRTFSGITFEEFYQKNYVGIGFNDIPYNYIQEAKKENEQSKENLKKYLEIHTTYEKGEITKWANQIINFQHEIKINDVVIIPSHNSDFLAIGTIESDVKLVKNPGSFSYKDKIEMLPQRRRKVNWILARKKSYFRNDFNGIFSSRQAITNISDYSEAIESYISSLFIKGEKAYLSISVNQDEDINAFELSKLLNSLTYFYREFCLEFDSENFSEELYIKIKVQSKGRFVLKAISTVGLLGLGVLFALSHNPELRIQLGSSIYFEGKSGGGFLKSLDEFLENSHRRKTEYQILLDSIEANKAKRTRSNDEPFDQIEENGE